jgi:hypothetical protein
MVLAPFPGFSRIYRHYALSGKRRARRRRGAIGDFENLPDLPVLGPSNVLIEVVFAYMYS